MRQRRNFFGRGKDIIWVALVACALAVPAAIADGPGSGNLKNAVKEALEQATRAKKKANRASRKANNANKKSTQALETAEETSQQQGPAGPQGDKGDPGDPAPTLSSGRVTMNFGETTTLFSSGPLTVKAECVANDGGGNNALRVFATTTVANSTIGTSGAADNAVFGPGDSSHRVVAAGGAGNPLTGSRSLYVHAPPSTAIDGVIGGSLNLAGSNCVVSASAFVG